MATVIQAARTKRRPQLFRFSGHGQSSGLYLSRGRRLFSSIRYANARVTESQFLRFGATRVLINGDPVGTRDVGGLGIGRRKTGTVRVSA